MSELNAYIPMDRRQALARRESLPDRTTGTALFADISGFTSLTAVLAEELGPQRGAEMITHHLNAIYSRLIHVVHQYHGSVVGFSGDAITCWFDGDDGLRGVAAAYGMQQVVAEMDVIIIPSGQQIFLSIKTAVATGAVRRFLVGDAQINIIDVLAGRLLDTLAAIEQSLSRGEIGLDMSLAPVIEGSSQAATQRMTRQGHPFFLLSSAPPEVDGLPWADHIPIPNEVAGQWLLPPVLQQLERAPAGFLAELRPVVACFISFSGIDFDSAPDAEEKLGMFIQSVQTIMVRYGGYLLELTVGDKGSYMYAAFGAPHAHEDDADRAISAAWELSEANEAFDYIHDLRIGISQSRMRAGAYGSPSRRTYGVHGVDVNLAARLMTQAEPGQILVSKHLAEASRSKQYFFQELGELQLKGFPKPVTTYVVFSREAKAPAPAAVDGDMIGRDSERFLLNQYLYALRKGERNLVLVEGEAGIGKSHLIVDLLKTAQSQNIIYLFGAGDAIEQMTPYHAWRMVVYIFLDVSVASVALDSASKHRLRQQVLARLTHIDPELLLLAPLLNIFLPLDFPENELTEQMSDVTRADNVHDLIIRLLQETAVVTPLLLILEDAHWFDSSSWTLLRLVQRAVSPLFIVVTTRPQSTPPPPDYILLLNHPDTHHMLLSVLPETAINSLVCKRLGVQNLPEPITRLLYEKAEGHPFFSEELAYALRDARIIRIENGACVLSPDVDQFSSLIFLDTIQGVILSRLDQLLPQQQITLKAASIIGRLFAFQILQDIYPVHEDQQYLMDNLLELEQLKIILQEIPEPDLAYIFKHNITQEVAYNLMTFAQRKQLHQQTAEVYETYYAHDLNSAYELLAHHWSRAEDSIKAIYYLEKAGEQAVRNAADEEAIHFFTKALELDEAAGFICKKNRRARWHLRTGEAYVNWTRYKKGFHHLTTGLMLLNKPKPAGSAIKKVGRVIQQILRQDVYKRRPPRFVEKSDAEREELLAASRAYSRLVEIDYVLGDLVGSIFDSFYALNLAEEAGLSAELAEATAPVGFFWSIVPWRSRAESYMERALQTAENTKNIEAISYALLVQGTYLAGAGRWLEVTALFERLIALNTQFASRRLNDGYHHLSRAYYLQGYYEESLKTAVSLQRAAKKINNQRFEAYSIQCQVYSLLYRGQLHDALDGLNTLCNLFNGEKKIDDEQMELDTYGLLALAHLRLDNLNDAFRFAILSDGLTSPFPNSYYNLPGYANPAEVYLALWVQAYQEPSLPKLAQQACKTLNSYARIFTIGKPRAYLMQGLYAWRKGKKRKAHQLWQKGLTAAEPLNMPYEQGRLHYEIGRHADEFVDQQNYLQKALAIFKRLGATYDLNQVKKYL
ncbi:MAG: AAA family ATPase [Chloroflexi bacterium]|nr:AAA family ATPase [Chloroflexota bacterium]